MDGTKIHDGDKMIHATTKDTTMYEVKFYKGNWWLFFGKDMPWMMLIPAWSSGRIAQYKVIRP